MYTELKTYQIIIALLKKYGIKHCVLSAGSRNVPFVHSIEEDPDFHCYSVVDERSAGYFALGLAQELNEPVVISCTSSTATCNYWPPVAEAFYQDVPIVVLTSDRDPEMLGQWEDQMIDQVGMYDRHVRKSVNLPIIHDHDDEIYCQRLVNEALLELNHHGTGPVHINVPMKSYNNSFNIKKLPEVTKFERLCLDSEKALWDTKIETLKKAKRILVTCGQNSYASPALKKSLSEFFKKYNSTISVEYMSNVDLEEGLNLNVCMDARYVTKKKVKELLPDIVISFGGNIFSGIKEQLRKFDGEFEHWLIQEDGRVVDLYKSITTIFECKPEYFFQYCVESAGTAENDLVYHKEMKQYVDSVAYPDFPYSHVYAIKEVVEKIPSDSILHLSINDSIRIANFFKLSPNIKTYANIGTHGIDGCLSSFLGQAAAVDKPSFLVIGDLAFFYDMNALRLRHIGNNVHILLINNEGGSEFYFNHMWKNNASDLHTTARHHTKAEGWVRSNNFIYLSAHDKESLGAALQEFMRDDLDAPVFLEVFTEMKADSDVIYDFFDLSRPRDVQSETIRRSKEFIKATIGQEKAQKIAGFLKH
ncbi:2-succinyl-5-enolpyruvyl-6-hydroxy-3-cyclohexene-1-carboxylic-acid synthase [Bifidobacterium pseudocatenulatum]|uniref:2-succinyl-5-enolpyruvyl-6-hydroxy-3-cyclohexene-1-carboxylic-acid synthase n=1 Tax=Bifidobacterium pseudocatenulatum TaxID=28026 RepID=A0AAQ0RVV6_BIFPS|nr:2-succinyl-5-enolpyruvyl-6-hydroxy-3-cyclohexene-1-carboxylic-acid synthase [Bifidobacterium pseudocatenulatum]RHL96327.1 2-succinyl-5-enolpyruvyl-6-hydroxy-3-cyclohexene-1-carboxylic-acid synthase [Bifidobacterium pseudocatenulatum]